MIVSRFTSFAKKFVIRSYYITQIFRSRHDCTSAFAARSPCNFGSDADIAISVLREVSFNTVLARYHSGRSHNGSPRTLSLSLFLLRFWYSSGSRDGSLRTLSVPLVLSLLVDAGCCVGATASCDEDVGEESEDELEELVDKPGTMKGT